jgi:hypothetical protein
MAEVQRLLQGAHDAARADELRRPISQLELQLEPALQGRAPTAVAAAITTPCPITQRANPVLGRPDLPPTGSDGGAIDGVWQAN